MNFAVGKQYLLRISSAYLFVALSYPACNAYALYYHLWLIWLQNIFFSHYLTNDTIFWKEKKLLYIKCVFSFFYIFFWNISHSNKM